MLRESPLWLIFGGGRPLWFSAVLTKKAVILERASSSKRRNVSSAGELRCGNFDMILDFFARLPRRSTAPHAPCTMLSPVPGSMGC